MSRGPFSTTITPRPRCTCAARRPGDGVLVAHRGKQMYYRVTASPTTSSSGATRASSGRTRPDTTPTRTRTRLKVGKRLYVFWRAEAGASAAGQAAYSVSDDEGDTWEPGRVLLQNATQRPYVKYDARGDTIHVAYTEGHPNATQTGIRYVAFRDGHLYRADGTAIADPPVAAAACCRRGRHPRQATRVGVDAGARLGEPAGDRLRDVPRAQRPPLPLRALERDAVDRRTAGARGRLDRPRRARAPVLRRHRAGSRRPVDRVPVAQDPRGLRDRALAHPRPRAHLDARGGHQPVDPEQRAAGRRAGRTPTARPRCCG